MKASVTHSNENILINGYYADWRSTVRWSEGSSSGYIVFTYTDTDVGGYKIDVNLDRCGFHCSRMEEFDFAPKELSGWNGNCDIWASFLEWLHLPEYDFMKDGKQTFRDCLADQGDYARELGKIGCPHKWNVVGMTPNRVKVLFAEEKDAKGCCRLLALFLQQVLNGTAMRTIAISSREQRDGYLKELEKKSE